jgi:hypothetical protein
LVGLLGREWRVVSRGAGTDEGPGCVVQPGIVEVDGERGISRSYVEEILEDNDGNAVRVYGVYDDEVVVEDGAWRFAVRRYNVLYRGPVELTGDKTGYRGSKIR